MAGSITWQTTVSMENDTVAPAITDWFSAPSNTIEFSKSMFNKYTQYVENALTEDGGMVRVDFGHVKSPRYVFFRNKTPDGKEPTSIYIAVGLTAVPFSYGDLADSYGDSSGDAQFMPNMAMVYEVPPGGTVGPIVVPVFSGYSAYDFDHSLSSHKGATLYFYAYLGRQDKEQPTSQYATEEYLEAKARVVFEVMDSLGDGQLPETIGGGSDLRTAIGTLFSNVMSISAPSVSNLNYGSKGRPVTESTVLYTLDGVEGKFSGIGDVAIEINASYSETGFQDMSGLTGAISSLNAAITAGRDETPTIVIEDDGKYATEDYVTEQADARISKYTAIADSASALYDDFLSGGASVLSEYGDAVLSLCGILEPFGTPTARGVLEYRKDVRTIINSSTIQIEPGYESSESSATEPTCMWDDQGWFSNSSSEYSSSDSESEVSSMSSSESSSSNSQSSSASYESSSSGGGTPSASSASSESSDSSETSEPSESSEEESSESASSESASSESASSWNGDYGAMLLVWAYGDFEDIGSSD